ncbi:hypothetical protein [Geodermatophilus chilensis]|nr:hypothetical protein [Geodermatophilus chilensis]
MALADGEPATDLPLAREALAFARSRRDAVTPDRLPRAEGDRGQPV